MSRAARGTRRIRTSLLRSPSRAIFCTGSTLPPGIRGRRHGHLPSDCFGFGWTLPTIAAHSGALRFLDSETHVAAPPFHGTSKIPFEIGLWQGVDGSPYHGRDGRAQLYDQVALRRPQPQQVPAGHRPEQPSECRLPLLWYGGHGRRPTIESVRALELGLQGDGPVEIISATSDRLYKDYLPYSSHPELPVWNGELLMDVHATGCYTSQAAMKLYNRRNEQLADAAERSAVAADWLRAVPTRARFSPRPGNALSGTSFTTTLRVRASPVPTSSRGTTS